MSDKMRPQAVDVLLDDRIRAAAGEMLRMQAVTKQARQEFGPKHENTMLALIEMSLQRGRFEGLVEAWMLTTGSMYPVEEVQAGWLR